MQLFLKQNHYFGCSSARLRRLLSSGLFELSSALMCICRMKMGGQTIIGTALHEWIVNWIARIPDRNQRAWWLANVSFLPALLAKCLRLPWAHGPYAMVSVAQPCIAAKRKLNDINGMDEIDRHHCPPPQGSGTKLTAIHWFFITWSMVNRLVGSTFNIPCMSFFAWSLTFCHSGFGKSNCPRRMRFFMPGDMAKPWLL